ncbi:MAG TPA: metallophosphoesterase [Methyloceanibacter sp.]|nr:metallophosphoesterase [Methyloceanibacter sp.]
MATRVFVISDLHLGGGEGFQMCSAAGRARLARFIEWVAAQKQEVADLWLVLNGDVVDFLAETDDAGGFSAFNVDQAQAVRKLTRIAESCEDFFAALKKYVKTGAKLTVLLGNHDVELSLPAVRTEFLSRLGGGDVEFLYDNEAFSIGPVLIEHGNRYDDWNMVNHNQLREIRSRLSRREASRAFAAQPGSELVAQLMNPLKKKFAFVDLLKPETGAVVPILAVLNPTLWMKTAPALKRGVLAWHRGRFTEEGTPEQDDYVAGEVDSQHGQPVPDLPETLSKPFAEATALIADLPPASDEISFVDDVAIPALLEAFRRWRSSADLAFNINHEDGTYLEKAQILANRGFKVVIFGHTHHAKRIDLEGGAVYLNTGTWADLMRLPPSVYAGSQAEGAKALKEFLQRVKANDINAFRRQVATFARIDLDARRKLEHAGTYFFDADGKTSPISTQGVEARLL